MKDNEPSCTKSSLSEDEQTCKSTPRCEGYRRYGGALTIGLPRWVQCENNAVVLLTVEQDGKILENLPTCLECWDEGVKLGAKPTSIQPLTIINKKKKNA
jgi:hypothetical protein